MLSMNIPVFWSYEPQKFNLAFLTFACSQVSVLSYKGEICYKYLSRKYRITAHQILNSEKQPFPRKLPARVGNFLQITLRAQVT